MKKIYHLKDVMTKSSLWTNQWLDDTFSNKLLKEFSDEAFPLDADPIVIVYGKECHSHRRVGFFSDETKGYPFAGQIAASKPLNDTLRTLLIDVNRLLGTKFNGVLVNHYRDGTDYIGAHSDDESTLSDGVVAALSVGASRKFRIHKKGMSTVGDKEVKDAKIMDVQTGHGQLLVMDGEFQKHYKHSIPIEKRVKGDRISITFRRHIINIINK